MISATDAFLWRVEREERQAREYQEWCHFHVFQEQEARDNHDWDACPLCDRIPSEKRFPGIATMPPLSPRMKHQRELKLQRRERRARTRRQRRREQRS